MASHLAPPHVRKYYPAAIKSSWFIRSFLWFVKAAFGKDEEQVALLLSVCSDDLNSAEQPETAMIGPFTLGGLDGYPFGGKTGIGAFSHHVPENGVALLYFGPHVGITNQEQVGAVVRPGQSKPSACCGAARQALEELEAGAIRPKKISEYEVDDFQQEFIRQVVLAHERRILGAGPKEDPRRFLTLTEVLYQTTRDAMHKLLASVTFEEPAFAFGGILINEDDGAESDTELRAVYRIENHQLTDLTSFYREKTAEQFQALEEGNLDAFKYK
jgi:hypothetical protein